jgi:DNA-binding transcriptional MerR regulator
VTESDISSALTFTISQLAEEFSVTPRAIRFYEDKGLLTPSRIGMSRVYAPRDRVRLSLILQGKRVGFTLADIKEMLDLYDLEDGQKAQMRVSLKKFRERIESLKEQQKDIETAIRDLTERCAVVEDMMNKQGIAIDDEEKAA